MTLIKRPIVTEKSIAKYESENKVTFEVSLGATKSSAAKMVEKVYGVKVEDVWVTNRLGKTKLNPKTRQPMRKTKDRKIMVFKLKKGDKIDIFNGA
ncbi:MAG: hypothetical protein Kow0081_2840 [Candidatus Dojkabacteria bacterium]